MPCNQNCCGKVAVHLTRIFDGAQKIESLRSALVLDNFSSNYALPLTYVSSEYSGVASITSREVSFISGERRSRVNLTYAFPVIVRYIDANGVAGTATSQLVADIDLLLTVPYSPYDIEVEVEYASRIGNIIDGIANETGCLKTIVKILNNVELVLPCNVVKYPDAVMTDNISCNAFLS